MHNASALAQVVVPNISLPVSIPVYSPWLGDELDSCSIRLQIRQINSLASLEYVDRTYLSDLATAFGRFPSVVGLPAGFAATDIAGNLTLMVTQLDSILTYFNSSIPTWCASLPFFDQTDCYAFGPCVNYTFGNITALGLISTPAPTAAPVTAAPTAAPTNITNATAAPTTAPTTAPTVVPTPSLTAITTALGQGAYMADSMVNSIIATVPLISNSTLQMQLVDFATVHAQHASYLRMVSGISPFLTPDVTVSATSLLTTFDRNSVAVAFRSFVTNPMCCDGFRGVHAVAV